MNEDERVCREFARRHHMQFQPRGEVGFCRPCSGFLKGESYVDLNPYDRTSYEPLWPQDARLAAPAAVDAYHKHDCLSVLWLPRLEDTDESDSAARAVGGLARWVTHLQALGPLQVVAYETGAVGLQAMFTGAVGVALRFAPAPPGVEDAPSVIGPACHSVPCRSAATTRVFWPVLPAEDFPLYCDACAGAARSALETLGHKYHAEALPVRLSRRAGRAISLDGRHA